MRTLRALGQPIVSLSMLPLLLPISLMLIMLITFHQAHAFCPNKCSCNGDNNLRVDCASAGLEVVPIQLNPDVTFINLTANQIQNVHFTLQFYMQLETLDLSLNRIVALGSRNFDAQEQLVTLNLSRNAIAHLPKDAFRGLRQLRLLDLSHNHITTIHAMAMLDLDSLDELNLADNAVISLDEGTFKNLVSLQMLNFRANELLDVPTDNLRYTRSLRHLDLSGNFIESMQNHSFAALANLRSLQVTGNVLSEVEPHAFEGLQRLQRLDMADNNLTSVPSKQLSQLSNLSCLSLSGNSLTTLPELAFVKLFQLKELHLNRLDRLTHIHSRALVDNTFLQTIWLDDNTAFASIPPDLFFGNPKVTEIRMRGNALQTIHAGQLPIDQLHKLYLADNPFVCNCSLLWLWRLTNGVPLTESPSTIPTTLLNLRGSASNPPITVDKDKIACNVWHEQILQRRIVLRDLTTNEIECPASASLIVLSLFAVFLMLCLGVLLGVYVRRRRRKWRHDRKNVLDRLGPQTVGKVEFEYRSQLQQQQQQLHHQQWERPPRLKDEFDELDHYEHFDDDFRYDHRRHIKEPPLHPPNVVYV